jgi:capsular polysaccharide export protein
MMKNKTGAAHTEKGSRLFVYNLGFLFQTRLRQILKAHGLKICIGRPKGKTDAVAVWGRTKVSKRGRAVAERFNKPLVTIEDAFLRSVLTGRQGAMPMGLIADQTGIYFDTSTPNDLEALLTKSLKVSPKELDKAADLMAHMCDLKLSKYNDFTNEIPDLPDDFVLVVDQTLNDASITMGGGNASSFADMLVAAKNENPNKTIVIKTHPETHAGKRAGYFSEVDICDQCMLLTTQVPPMMLFRQASKVYCVTSQVGLEAIFAGHRPIVFGRAFYAGLGLTDDRALDSKKDISLSVVQLFWATHLQYSKWYDPFFDRATDFLTVVSQLHAQSKQNQENYSHSFCIGMRLWKRGFLKTYLSGVNSTPRFMDHADDAVEKANLHGGRILVWAGKETTSLAADCAKNEIPLIRVEDGFLRSVGLGAQLVAPVSLALDDTGIYYDPTRPSQLERILNEQGVLSNIGLKRAKAVQERIIALKMTKYNVGLKPAEIHAADAQEIILVPGQVEDDASIIKGTDQMKTNLSLLEAARRDFPDSCIVYKPHPDVEAGLRVGEIPAEEVTKHADYVATQSSMADLLGQVDRVVTLTSLAGFEALLRGKSVTCYGSPFYSGWGLTDDKAPNINRRKARPDMASFIHACLIEYPRYWDPVLMQPCPIEVILERFERGEMQTKGGVGRRLLAKAQGVFASYAYLWR